MHFIQIILNSGGTHFCYWCLQNYKQFIIFIYPGPISVFYLQPMEGDSISAQDKLQHRNKDPLEKTHLRGAWGGGLHAIAQLFDTYRKNK